MHGHCREVVLLQIGHFSQVSLNIRHYTIIIIVSDIILPRGLSRSTFGKPIDNENSVNIL